jgi:hypothetical protein
VRDPVAARLAHVREHLLAVVSPQNSASRARELHAGPAAPRRLHHVDLPLRQMINAAPCIEVRVDKACETSGIPSDQRVPAVGRQFGKTLHRADHRLIAAIEAFADVVVKHLRRLPERLVVRDVQRREQRSPSTIRSQPRSKSM